MTNRSLPTRAFREHTDLDQLKRQAKELLEAFRTGDAAAVTEVNSHYRGADATVFALHDAQLVLARAFGFESWPKMKAYVDGITAKGLVEAVRAGDLERVHAMLRARPELVNMDMGEDEHRAIHYAVMDRSLEITRILMQYGADARQGIHPHRDATSALTIASERGYDDIVAIIREAEQRRRETHAGGDATAAPEDLFCIDTWQTNRAMAILRADPALVHSANPNGATPLHAAASVLHLEGIAWLLDHGADPNCRAHGTRTPLDVAASGRAWCETGNPSKFKKAAKLLLSHGAYLGALSAVALGNMGWVRAHHAEGTLPGADGNSDFAGLGGLLSAAVRHDQPEMLALLLELGFDPDERWRVEGMDEIVWSGGGPLYDCVTSGKRKMAEMLLAKGADPNASVYTSGSALYRAHLQKDRSLVQLLERHGGFLDAVSAGFLRGTEAARQMLEDEAAGRLREGAVAPGKKVAEELLWTAAGGGDAEIVRMALERIDWPRQDSRWLWAFWQAFTCDGGIKRGLDCFRLLLTRADPNLSNAGRTMLHTIMARGEKNAVPYAEMMLAAGARMDIRDELLRSTVLGWACRWGRVHFVKLLLERGADPVEKDAEPWASPRVWAQKMKHGKVLSVLREYGG